MSRPTIAELTHRIEEIERDLADLREKLGIPKDDRPWWQKVRGLYAGDPHFEEAMRLGREYRESLRPKLKRKTTTKKKRTKKT